jgi:hypothetical protein
MLKPILSPTHRVLISAMIAISTIMGSATIFPSSAQVFRSMAECEAQARALSAANPYSRYWCQPISSPNTKKSSRKEVPQWLRDQWNRGRAFNKSRSHAYPHNEVYVKKINGNGYNVLDSYNPRTREIVSRKFTQFSKIKEKTAIDYINEIGRKYEPGTQIANVPSVPKALRGTRLQGDKILEVPVQIKPIPEAILKAARRAKVIIRDVNGRVYNP